MVRVAESNSEMTHGSIFKLDTSRGDVNDGCMVSPDSGKKSLEVVWILSDRSRWSPPNAVIAILRSRLWLCYKFGFVRAGTGQSGCNIRTISQGCDCDICFH